MDYDRVEMRLYKLGRQRESVYIVFTDTIKMTGFKTFFVVFAAVCLAQQATSGKTPRGAEEAGESVQIQDVIQRGRETIQNVTGQVTALLGLDNLPDAEKVKGVLTNQTQVLSDSIQGMITNIQNEVKTGDGTWTSLLESMSTRLTEAANSLHAAAPGVKRDATDIQDQITASLNIVFDEAGKLAKAIGGEASTVQEDLAKLARTTAEQAVVIGKQVEQKVQTAIEESKAAAAATS